MAVELATAYIALVPSMKGASAKIAQELGSVDADGIGHNMGSRMGGGLVGSLKGLVVPALAVLGSGMFGGFIKDAAAASDATDKFVATMSFAGMDTSAITAAKDAAKSYADQTVYDLPTIQNMTAQLASNGVKDYTGLTQAAGNLNAVAGGNAETFKSVAMVMTQTAGAGKLTTENWNQMADAIPGAAGPLMKAMQDAGAYTGNFRDAMAAGQITSDEFNAALQKLGTDPVAVEAARSTKTFEGAIGGLQATINSGLMSALNAMKPAITGAINLLSNGLGKAFQWTGQAATALYNLFAKGDFSTAFRQAFHVEEDSGLVRFLFTARNGALALKSAFSGEGITSDGFVGVMEHIGVAARTTVLGVRAIGSAFSGEGVTSDGFVGAMEHIGVGARAAFNISSEASQVFVDGLLTGSNTAEGGVDGLAAKVGNGLHNSFLVASEGASVFWDGLKTGSNGATGGIDGIASQIGNTLHSVFTGISPMIAQLSPVIMPLIPQFMSLFSSISPIQTIFQALAPFIPQLLDVFVQLAAVVGQSLSTALTSIVPIFIQMQALFISVFQQVLAIALPVIVQLVTMLGQTFAQLLPILMPIIVQVATLAMTLVSQLAPIFMQLVSAVLPMVVTIFGAIMQAIGPVIQIVAGMLIPLIQFLMPVVVTVFGVIANVITSVMQIIMGVIQVVTGIISGNWDQVWTGIMNIFGGIWNTIVALVTGVLAIIGSVVISALSFWLGFIGGILGNIGQFFADTWNNITNGISSFVGGIGSFFAGIPGTIMAALSGAGTWLFDAGKNIVQGLFDGIKSLAGTIGNFFLGLLPGWIVEPFKIALGIQSPSRLFRQFGRHIGEGLMLGTEDTKDDISTTMRSLVTVPDMPTYGANMPAASGYGRGVGVTNNYTINQVDDPIGTAHAIARRQTALSV